VSKASAQAVRPTEPIPDGIDLSPFLIGDARRIAAELQGLAELATPVTLYPAPQAPFILGRLAAVNIQAGSFVYEPLGEPDIAAGELLFVATLNGVRFQFSCSWSGQAGPVARFTAPLPAQLVKLQRRRFARLEAPLGLPFRAEFGLAGRSYALNVDDLGLGGVGLRAAPREAALLYVGRRLSRVSLLLGHEETIMVDLDVRSRRAWHTYLLGEQFLVGCRFIDLAASQEDSLRRALAQLEQERAERH
jgi:flagellar brake protein